MNVDSDDLKQFQFRLFSTLSGAVTAAMVHLGDRLGLYEALAAASGPLTSTELAVAAQCHERWVREWLYNQASAGLVAADSTLEPVRFSLTPAAVAVLASPDHEAFGMGMFHRLPRTMEALETMPESFRTGLGHDYDAHGCDGAIGMERSFQPWNQAHLVADVIPLLDGVDDALRTGIRAADVGCGAGGAVLLLAAAYPRSNFVGYDISRHALERAAERLADTSLTNAHFVDPRDVALPTDGGLGFVTTFDCLHDMTDPAAVMTTIRQSLGDDGTWLLVDIKAFDTYAMNAERNPMAPLMYGISVLSCLSSALSEPSGAGLGTLGLSESRAREMATEAGFSRFRRLPVEHAVNAFFEIRP